MCSFRRRFNEIDVWVLSEGCRHITLRRRLELPVYVHVQTARLYYLHYRLQDVLSGSQYIPPVLVVPLRMYGFLVQIS